MSWRAVMGDWEGRGRLWREGRLLGAVVVRGAKGKGVGCDDAEIVGDRVREEESAGGGWCGGRGRPRLGKGWQRVPCQPLSCAASGTLTGDFFPQMCWEWVGLCRVRLARSKGGERGLISDGPPKTHPHVYTHTFNSFPTATKIEEAGGSIPSFSS